MLSEEFSTSHLITAQYAQSRKRMKRVKGAKGKRMAKQMQSREQRSHAFDAFLPVDLRSGGSQSITPTLSGAWGDSPFLPPASPPQTALRLPVSTYCKSRTYLFLKPEQNSKLSWG